MTSPKRTCYTRKKRERATHEQNAVSDAAECEPNMESDDDNCRRGTGIEENTQQKGKQACRRKTGGGGRERERVES